MITKPIHSEEAYNAALKRLDELFDMHRNKEEQAEFDRLAELIDAYEEEKWPLEEDDTQL